MSFFKSPSALAIQQQIQMISHQLKYNFSAYNRLNPRKHKKVYFTICQLNTHVAVVVLPWGIYKDTHLPAVLLDTLDRLISDGLRPRSGDTP